MAMTGVQDLLKFKDLVRKLKIPSPHALGILETIWLYCHQHAVDPRGVLFSVSDLEALAEWNGEDGHLVAAMLASRWLDQEGEKVYPHDYLDHAPEFVQRRIGRAVYRKSQKTAVNGETLTGKMAKTPVTDGPTVLTRPDPTRPNRSDKTDPITPEQAQDGGAERQFDTTELFSKLGCSKPAPLIDETMAASGDGEHMRPWWAKVIDLHRNPDRLSEFIDDLKHVQDSKNPATRQAKGLGGEFDAPGKWLVKQCKERLGGLPRFPKAKGE